MVIHEKQQVYIHIPKCGGVSVQKRFIAKYHTNERNGFVTLQNRNWQGNLLSGFQRKHKEKAKGRAQVQSKKKVHENNNAAV